MSPHEQYDPAKRLPPIDESLVINTLRHEIERRQSEEKAEEKEYKRRQLRFTKWTVFFTALLFLTSAVSDFLMVKYVALTKQSADAASIAAKAASDTLEHIKTSGVESTEQTDKVIENLRSAADSAKSGVKQNQSALAATLKQGKDALDASINTSRLDQRPWLSVPTFVIKAEPTAEEDTIVNGLLVNSGKTPAIGIIPQSIMFISASPPRMTTFPLAPSPKSRSILAPGTANFKFTSNPRRFAVFEIAAYTKGDARLFIHAIVRYDDTFGISHWSTVCAYRSHGEDVTVVNFCAEGNDMDNNQTKDDPKSPGERQPVTPSPSRAPKR